MDQNFQTGFCKTAIVGLIARFAAKQMPKIFKGLTHKAGKFSVMRTGGTALSGAFMADEASRVAKKTARDVNRHTHYNTLH